MNQERGEGTHSSRSSLIAIHVQVRGFLYNPSAKYKTILKTTHLPLIKRGHVHISKPSFKNNGITEQRQRIFEVSNEKKGLTNTLTRCTKFKTGGTYQLCRSLNQNLA